MCFTTGLDLAVLLTILIVYLVQSISKNNKREENIENGGRRGGEGEGYRREKRYPLGALISKRLLVFGSTSLSTIKKKRPVRMPLYETSRTVLRRKRRRISLKPIEQILDSLPHVSPPSLCLSLPPVSSLPPSSTLPCLSHT